MSIRQPVSTGILWNPSFAASRNARLHEIQKFIDSECLRYCDQLTPKITGNLIRSGQRGTKIGSGEMRYLAPYAAKQYYSTAESRSYDPHRGSHWFERMKLKHKQAILQGVRKLSG